jgi:hypothetical protein
LAIESNVFAEALQMTAEFKLKAVADLRKIASVYARLGATDKENELRAMAEDMELRFELQSGSSEDSDISSAN